MKVGQPAYVAAAVAVLGAIGIIASFPFAHAAPSPAQIIPLPEVEGRIDHFGIDEGRQRLYVAALGNGTVEVIDLDARRLLHPIGGFHSPQGIGFAPEANRLAVADAKDGTCRLFDGGTLKPAGVVELKDNADNIRYDAKEKLFYVGYGNGGIALIDPLKAAVVGEIKLEAHPEAFVLETTGKRAFVNMPGGSQVTVIDREKREVTGNWKIKEAAANFPIALDEKHGRLFVGCRRPATLLVLDTQSGKTVASLPCAGDCDDLFYDGPANCIYVSGGAGEINVFSQVDADHYKLLSSFPTAAGARTSLFVAQSQTLYLAVPHRDDQPAQIRAYKMRFGAP